jgi:hypothetical protein
MADSAPDFKSWRRRLSHTGRDQVAVVWVEEAAVEPGTYIVWAHTEPEGSHTATIAPRSAGADMDTAVEWARDWMDRNPRWPWGEETGLGGFGFGGGSR